MSRDFNPRKKFVDDGKLVKESSLECMARNFIYRFQLYSLELQRDLGFLDEYEKTVLEEYYRKLLNAVPSNRLLECKALVKKQDGAIYRYINRNTELLTQKCLRHEGKIVFASFLLTLWIGYSWYFYPIIYVLSFLIAYLIEKIEFNDDI